MLEERLSHSLSDSQSECKLQPSLSSMSGALEALALSPTQINISTHFLFEVSLGRKLTPLTS
jgi:hypothetical protein